MTRPITRKKENSMSEAEQQTNETLKRIQTVQELYGCLSAALTMEEAREERAEALTPPSSPSSSR